VTTDVKERPSLTPAQCKAALIALLAVGLLRLAAVGAASAPPDVGCKLHHGSFNNDFSTAFDISSLNCRLTEDWTIRFWAVSPYVGLEFTRPASLS
jgi:hypothetical protein